MKTRIITVTCEVPDDLLDPDIQAGTQEALAALDFFTWGPVRVEDPAASPWTVQVEGGTGEPVFRILRRENGQPMDPMLLVSALLGLVRQSEAVKDAALDRVLARMEAREVTGFSVDDYEAVRAARGL